MIPYYLLVILGFLCCLFDYVQHRYLRISVFAGYAGLLTLFAGLRSVGVDNDSINYEEAFKLTDKLEWRAIITGNYEVTMERGYLLLNKLIFTLGGSIQMVFFIMALLSAAVNYTLIYRKSPLPFTSLFIYVCFFYFYRDFTQIRFAFSAGLGLWAICCLVDRRYLHTVLLVLLACTFHSAALVVPLLALSYLLIKNKWFYLLLPVAGFIGGLFEPIVVLFQLGGLPVTLANYVMADEFGRGGYVVSFIAQLFLIGYLLFYEKLCAFYSERAVRIWYIALSLSSLINLLFISFAIMQRLSLLLFGVVLFMIPCFIRTLQTERDDKYLVTVFHFLFNIYMLYYGLKMIAPGLLQPYHLL